MAKTSLDVATQSLFTTRVDLRTAHVLIVRVIETNPLSSFLGQVRLFRDGKKESHSCLRASFANFIVLQITHTAWKDSHLLSQGTQRWFSRLSY